MCHEAHMRLHDAGRAGRAGFCNTPRNPDRDYRGELDNNSRPLYLLVQGKLIIAQSNRRINWHSAKSSANSQYIYNSVFYIHHILGWRLLKCDHLIPIGIVTTAASI